MIRASLLLLALAACGRNITSDTGPSPSASVAVKLVDLPKATSGDDFVQVVFAVDVLADGTYAVNGQRVAEDDIFKQAKDARAKSPDLRAVIRADGTVPYQRVITVMDKLRQAGIAKLAFAVNVDRPR